MIELQPTVTGETRRENLRDEAVVVQVHLRGQLAERLAGHLEHADRRERHRLAGLGRAVDEPEFADAVPFPPHTQQIAVAAHPNQAVGQDHQATFHVARLEQDITGDEAPHPHEFQQLSDLDIRERQEERLVLQPTDEALLSGWTLLDDAKVLDEGQQRFVICSGGGPGIMEAANRGAHEAKGLNVGLNISLPFEQNDNPYITRKLSFEFHYFFMRKFWFIYLAKAIVVMPGGFGTLDEFMEVLTLGQWLPTGVNQLLKTNMHMILRYALLKSYCPMALRFTLS